MTEKASADPLRVLIVDDRRDTILLLKTLLVRSGHDVMTADNGQDALDTVRDFCPHVVISDIGLTGTMDGYDLVEAVLADSTITPPHFIAVTGHDDLDHRNRAREAGFQDYLVKPARLDDLLALLSRIRTPNEST